MLTRLCSFVSFGTFNLKQRKITEIVVIQVYCCSSTTDPTTEVDYTNKQEPHVVSIVTEKKIDSCRLSSINKNKQKGAGVKESKKQLLQVEEGCGEIVFN